MNTVCIEDVVVNVNEKSLCKMTSCSNESFPSFLLVSSLFLCFFYFVNGKPCSNDKAILVRRIAIVLDLYVFFLFFFCLSG